jgi:hypothetical protein
MLEEEVIFTFVEDETVGIIHPIALRREVEPRTELLIEERCNSLLR